MIGEEFLTPESVEPLRRALGAVAGRFTVPDPETVASPFLSIPVFPSIPRLGLETGGFALPSAPASVATLMLERVRVVDRGRESFRWRYAEPSAPPPRVRRSGGRTGMVSRATPKMEALASTVVDAAMRDDAVEYSASPTSRMQVRPVPQEQLRRDFDDMPWNVEAVRRTTAELAVAEVLRNRGPLDGIAASMVEQMERRAMGRLRAMGQPRPPTSYASVEDVARVLPPGMGVDVEAMFARIERDAPFPWTRDESVFAEIRRALPYDVEIEALREPFDDVLRITLDRGEGRAIRWQDLARVRRALRGSDYVPMELRVVVRDAAQLRGMRDRALAPLLDPPPRLTREARFLRLYAAPKVPLP
ncbi:MAG: hypothetical protein Q8S73_31535 [Deltaproteobacteria bacterium]|nr:hypothetical protein [Myxococcales bacterium]MDP3218679.1 hypothetical protein [Deltaproteobacteria bacterium]